MHLEPVKKTVGAIHELPLHVQIFPGDMTFKKVYDQLRG
jgi:hypothetical protein